MAMTRVKKRAKRSASQTAWSWERRMGLLMARLTARPMGQRRVRPMESTTAQSLVPWTARRSLWMV